VVFPGPGIEAVQEPVEVGEIDQAVGHRGGGHRPPDLVELPDPPRVGDIATL